MSLCHVTRSLQHTHAVTASTSHSFIRSWLASQGIAERHQSRTAHTLTTPLEMKEHYGKLWSRAVHGSSRVVGEIFAWDSEVALLHHIPWMVMLMCDSPATTRDSHFCCPSYSSHSGSIQTTYCCVHDIMSPLHMHPQIISFIGCWYWSIIFTLVCILWLSTPFDCLPPAPCPWTYSIPSLYHYRPWVSMNAITSPFHRLSMLVLWCDCMCVFESPAVFIQFLTRLSRMF